MALIGAAWALQACDQGPTSFSEIIGLSFSVAELDMGFARTGQLQIRNVGDRELGPVEFSVSPAIDGVGTSIPDASLLLEPPLIAALPAGTSAAVSVVVSLPGDAAPGLYRSTLQASAGFGAVAQATLRFEVLDPTVEGVVEVAFVDPPSTVRQGDVRPLRIVATDADGQVLVDPPATWWVEPETAGRAVDGRFVGYDPGVATVMARVGTVVRALPVTVTERGVRSSFSRLGGASAGNRIGADLWVHGSYAYTGTWRGANSTGVPDGDAVFVWDVSDPRNPLLTDSIVVDSRAASDVKIRADGALGALVHRGSSDGLNGITFFTLQDPAHPLPLARFTDGLEAGVSNVWLDGDYAYAAVAGDGGLHVLDVADPAAPHTVSTFHAGSSFLEDVYVRDGLAFLSHWDAGLVILDVGRGVAGGTPQAPVEVGRILTDGGQTHNAWYWPDANLAFVGEEDFTTPGVLHVIDVSDLADPVEVATYGLPFAPPHNLWLDETRAILYAAWYEQGVRAIDVSGTLEGSLDRQGREIAAVLVGTEFRIWAPQLHDGLVFAGDMNASLQIVRPLF